MADNLLPLSFMTAHYDQALIELKRAMCEVGPKKFPKLVEKLITRASKIFNEEETGPVRKMDGLLSRLGVLAVLQSLKEEADESKQGDNNG